MCNRLLIASNVAVTRTINHAISEHYIKLQPISFTVGGQLSFLCRSGPFGMERVSLGNGQKIRVQLIAKGFHVTTGYTWIMELARMP